jgi:hypothetical protein
MDKMSFIKQIDKVEANGKLHKARLGTYIYDLVEEKIKTLTSPPQTQQCASTSCAENCPHILMYEERNKELTDTLNGLNQGFRALALRIDELEEKIENNIKKSKALKIKNSTQE